MQDVTFINLNDDYILELRWRMPCGFCNELDDRTAFIYLYLVLWRIKHDISALKSEFAEGYLLWIILNRSTKI